MVHTPIRRLLNLLLYIVTFSGASSGVWTTPSNQLSQYLRYVKNGEKILITEHDRIIAELSMPKGESINASVETELEKLAASGKLIKAKRNKSICIGTETSVPIDWISVYQENRSK